MVCIGVVTARKGVTDVREPRQESLSEGVIESSIHGGTECCEVVRIMLALVLVGSGTSCAAGF